jgi:glyoxylase-like metal-dependent hydrolase (beta-lactamase superfamily II)
MTSRVERYLTRSGDRIYRIPLELFPDLSGFAHLVVADGFAALVDTGSGFGESNQQLEAGLQAIRQEHGEPLDWADLTHLLITHGHIDHFGGLHFVRQRTQAPLWVHELDRRVLIRYEERVAVVAQRLSAFLRQAGLSSEEQEDLMQLYLLNKQLFHSIPVDFTYEEAGMQVGPLRAFHVPGHTPGHVVFLLDEVMLAGDHILPRISPHMAPELLTLHTGLTHYLDSLELLRPLAATVRLVLGGHESPFDNLEARIDEIRLLYDERLARTLELTRRPATVAQVAAGLFNEPRGYHRLLALEEAGAYVEYLEQRGQIGLENLDALNDPAKGAAYVRI